MDRSDYPEYLQLVDPDQVIFDHQVWAEGGLLMTALMVERNSRALVRTLGKALFPEGYNGYVRFPREVVGVDSVFGQYIEVRGGLTYSHRADDGSAVYGFDTNHAWDPFDDRIRDLRFIKGEIRFLARMLALAVPFWAALIPTDLRDQWDREWSDEQLAIVEGYREQVRLLEQEATVRDPLPEDFWERTAWHPLFRDDNS